MTSDSQQQLTNKRVDQLYTKNIDLRGNRVINAGTSVNPQDYVTRAELDALTTRVTALEQKLGIS